MRCVVDEIGRAAPLGKRKAVAPVLGATARMSSGYCHVLAFVTAIGCPPTYITHMPGSAVADAVIVRS